MTSFWKTIEPIIERLLDDHQKAERDVLRKDVVESLAEAAVETATEKQFSYLPPECSAEREVGVLRMRAKIIGEMVVCAARHSRNGYLVAVMPTSGENFGRNGDHRRDWLLGDLIVSYIEHFAKDLGYLAAPSERCVAYDAERAIDSAAIWSRLFDGPGQGSEEWQWAMMATINAVNVNTIKVGKRLRRQRRELRKEQDRLDEEKQNCLDKEKPLPFFAS